MSLLPQQIPPQTEPFAADDGKGNLIINVNWWLFLFNIGKQVLSGPTAPVPLPPSVSIALSDDDAADVDALQTVKKVESANTLVWLGM